MAKHPMLQEYRDRHLFLLESLVFQGDHLMLLPCAIKYQLSKFREELYSRESTYITAVTLSLSLKFKSAPC